MGADELGTIRTLTAYRDAVTNLMLLHRGRVVDAPGDNIYEIDQKQIMIDKAKKYISYLMNLKLRKAKAE